MAGWFWDELPERTIGVAIRSDSLHLSVDSIELFAAGLTVHWTDVATNRWPGPDPPIPLASRRAYRIELADDVGTTYAVAGGGSWSGENKMPGGVTAFKPAPPRNARLLTISISGETTQVALRD